MKVVEITVKEELEHLDRQDYKQRFVPQSSTPCCSCSRRGCGSYHDQCEKYQQFKEQKAAINAARMQKSEIYGHCIDTKNRIKKNHGGPKLKVFRSYKK